MIVETDWAPTFHQEVQLLHDRHARREGRHPTRHNVSTALEFAGAFDRTVLARALAAVMDSHAGLRVSFGPNPIGGTRRPDPVARPFLQRVWRSVPLPLDDIDLAESTGDARTWVQLMEQLTRQRFDLATPPLFRATLVRAAAQRHLLIVVMDHIISDRVTLRIIERELADAYTLIDRGERPALPDERCLGGFAAAQWEWLGSAACQPALDFWADEWRRFEPAFPSGTELPGARAEACGDAGWGRIVLTLDGRETEAIISCCRAQHATLFRFAAAALVAVVQRGSGRTEVPIWGNFANRRTAEGRCIGRFAIPHLIGIQAAPGVSASELMRGVRERLRQITAHQRFPIELLFQRRPDLIGAAPFRVKLDVDPEPPHEYDISPGLRMRRIALPGAVQRAPTLGVSVTQTATGLNAAVVFAKSLFSENGAAAFGSAFVHAMHAIARDPAVRIDRLNPRPLSIAV